MMTPTEEDWPNIQEMYEREINGTLDQMGGAPKGQHGFATSGPGPVYSDPAGGGNPRPSQTCANFVEHGTMGYGTCEANGYEHKPEECPDDCEDRK